jgi:hypothetical protein
LDERYKRVTNVTVVSWQNLLIAERTFRKLDATQPSGALGGRSH